MKIGAFNSAGQINSRQLPPGKQTEAKPATADEVHLGQPDNGLTNLKPAQPESDLKAKIGAALALASLPAGALTAWLTASSSVPGLALGLGAAVTLPMLLGGLTLADSGSSSGGGVSGSLADPANPASPLSPINPLNPANPSSPIHF